MTSAWNLAQQMADRHANQGGKYIRLKGDGDKVVGVFCGEPHAREVHWTGDKYVECTGDGCPLCADKEKKSLKVLINFYVPDEDKMKIFEGSASWFRTLLEVREKYGLEDYLFEMKRKGKPGDPQTTYGILPERKFGEDVRERLTKVQLHDLEHLGDDHKTVSEEQVEELKAVLTKLDKARLTQVLDEFSVKKVRELLAREADAMKKRAEELLASPDEVDPF